MNKRTTPEYFSAQGFPWGKAHLVLDEDVVWDSGISSAYFTTPDQSLCIIAGVWYIKAGTEWDGITNFWDGPPDPGKPRFPVTWLASLIHDLGCKYWGERDDFPHSRVTVDGFFFQELQAANFRYSKLYFIAVSCYTWVLYLGQLF